jgi:hypothetical protein
MNANDWIPTPISDPVNGRWPTPAENREGEILWQLKNGGRCAWSLKAVDQVAWQPMPAPYVPRPINAFVDGVECPGCHVVGAASWVGTGPLMNCWKCGTRFSLAQSAEAAKGRRASAEQSQETIQVKLIADSLFNAISTRGIEPDGSRRYCGDAAIYINNLIHMALQKKGNSI